MTEQPTGPACPGCGASAAREADRYCGRCGVPLGSSAGVGCLACGTANPDRARFCLGCGTPLGSVAEAERRVITVLFADISGFTAFTERMDPEGVHVFIGGCIDRLCDCVVRWGGFVDKFIGDCVMALFGAPVAYENEPERAVGAALDMHAALEEMGASASGADRGFRPRLRIGIHTGPVVTGIFSGGGTVDYTAVGDTVNVASRLQGICEPGETLVGAATYEQTRHIFDFGEERTVPVKGRREPVRVRRVIGRRRQRGMARGLEGRAARMIGRESELMRLESAWTRVESSGAGEVALVVGPAGIGKSRLMEEFLVRSGAGEGDVSRGRSYPYASNTPWEPISELLKDLHGVPARTEARRAARGIADAVERRRPGSWAGSSHREALAVALGDPASTSNLAAYGPAERLELVRGAVHDSLAAGPDAPHVCVLEDLHWADHTTLEFLLGLSRTRIEPPLLLVLIARPPLPGEVHLNRLIEAVETRIQLPALSEEESRRLLDSLLGRHELPGDLIASLLDRAGGNPLFIEESLKSMMASEQLVRDSGVWRATGNAEGARMPDTIESVLTTRIDGLNPGSRRVLQYASVVGRRFWSGVLADALARRPVDRELHELAQAAFVRPAPSSTVEADREFLFEHLLMQEAAYESVLRGTRSELHGAVAEWLERELGGRGAELGEWIAFHYERSEVPARAVPFLEGAARAAHERGAQADALSLIDRALERVETDAGRFRLLCLLEEIAHASAERGHREAAISKLEDLATGLDEVARLEAGYRRARLQLDTGDLAGARAAVRGLLDDELHPTAEISWQDDLLSLSGRIAHLWGDYPEALRLYRSALPLHRRSGDRAGEAGTLDRLGLVRVDVGDYRGGLDLLEQALEIARELGHGPLEARVRSHRSEALRCLGRHTEAEAEAHGSLDRAESAGSRRARWTAELTLGLAVAAAGRADEAAERLLRVCDSARELGRPRLEARARLALADLAAGAEARAHGAAARERAGAGGLVHVEVLARVREAELALDSGEMEAADRASEEALHRLREHGSIQGPEERVVHTRARVLAALGRDREAAVLFEEAAAIVRETAAYIPEPAERERFLQEVPLNRVILDAARRAAGARRG